VISFGREAGSGGKACCLCVGPVELSHADDDNFARTIKIVCCSVLCAWTLVLCASASVVNEKRGEVNG
jgi:hypothetical protein